MIPSVVKQASVVSFLRKKVFNPKYMESLLKERSKYLRQYNLAEYGKLIPGFKKPINKAISKPLMESVKEVTNDINLIKGTRFGLAGGVAGLGLYGMAKAKRPSRPRITIG